MIVPSLMWLFSAQKFPNEYIMIMAIATSLATIILTSTSSVISHYKLGNIILDRVFRLTPGILFGAGIGAVVADFIPTEVLRWFFISYLLYVGFRMAIQAGSVSKGRGGNKWLDYIAGNGIGFLSAILGIGGGTLTVPYLLSRHIPMKNAVAVSSACGLPIAISGAVVYAWLGWDKAQIPDWSLGYIYLPALCGILSCSIVTAPIGAKLAYKLPAKKLKQYFSVVILLIAFKMIVR